MLKTCTRCNLLKENNSYYKDTRRPNGLRSKCIECTKKERKIYCENNKVKRAGYAKQYRPRCNEARRERYQTDPAFRLAILMRTRVRDALKLGGERFHKRSGGELLGCTYEEYETYIEQQFEEGMSWEDVFQGRIHIDHILPCTLFNLNDELAQKVCFNYRNTRPMWAQQNLQKSKKIPINYFWLIDEIYQDVIQQNV